MKLHSSVKTAFLNTVLFKGAIFSFLGSFLLISSLFMPLNFLSTYGFILLIIASYLIGKGLYPYQKLKMLQIQPHEIYLDDKNLIFSWKKKPAFMISLELIEKVTFQENSYASGICLNLKKHFIKEAKIIDQRFDLTLFVQNCQTEYGCDLFFPYFSKKSFLEVVDSINQSPD